MAEKTQVAPAATPARNWMTMVAPPVFVVLWSSAFIAGVIGVGAAPPLLLVFARFALAGLILAGFALVTRAPWPRGKLLLHVAISGLLMQVVQFGAFYVALSTGMPAAVVALLQGLNPVVIALLASRVLGERLGPRQWIGFGLGAVGVVLAVADQVKFSAVALILCLVGLLGLSLGTVYQKKFTPAMDIRTGTAVQFLVSAPVVGILMLALEKPVVYHWGGFLGALAWIVFINSIGAFVLLNLMLRRQAASRVSTLFFLTPAVTAVLAWLLIGQALQPLVIVGLVVGAVGVLLASTKATPKPAPQKEAAAAR